MADRRGDVFARASGFADAFNQVPIQLDTRFRLASVTKVITRTAIGRLVDEGRISLGAPVRTYVSGLPQEMGAITVEQLLQHRSGIPPMKQFDDDDPTYISMITAQNAMDLLPVLAKQHLIFPPGTRQEYSNGGFMLLGIVIEAITGKTYGDYLREAVFRPLRMKSSTLRADRNTAVPMTGTGSSREMAPAPYPNRIGLASGDSVSSAGDLLKLARALREDNFISAATKARVFQDVDEPPFASIFQDGATAGVSTVFLLANDGTALVILTNRDAPAAELMGRALLSEMGIFGSGCATRQGAG